MERFGSQLRKRAKELGLSQAEAARRSGLSEHRYGHYVRGIREPDLATLARIAKALQTTPNELLGLGGEKSERSRRSLLRDRLNSAIEELHEKDIELVLTQTEAIVNFRRGSKRGD
jgi:transcriptional regulator with XRE-family HTH domain